MLVSGSAAVRLTRSMRSGLSTRRQPSVRELWFCAPRVSIPRRRAMSPGRPIRIYGAYREKIRTERNAVAGIYGRLNRERSGTASRFKVACCGSSRAAAPGDPMSRCRQPCALAVPRFPVRSQSRSLGRWMKTLGKAVHKPVPSCVLVSDRVREGDAIKFARTQCSQSRFPEGLNPSERRNAQLGDSLFGLSYLNVHGAR